MRPPQGLKNSLIEIGNSWGVTTAPRPLLGNFPQFFPCFKFDATPKYFLLDVDVCNFIQFQHVHSIGASLFYFLFPNFCHKANTQIWMLLHKTFFSWINQQESPIPIVALIQFESPKFTKTFPMLLFYMFHQFLFSAGWAHKNFQIKLPVKLCAVENFPA